MKKTFLFLCALAVSAWSMAQGYEPLPDIVVFDFDNVDPVFDYADPVHENYVEIGPDTIIKVANPNKDAVNSSEWVGQYTHKSPRQYEGVYFVDQPDSRIYNTIELKYLIPPGVMGRIQYKVITNDNIPDTTFNVVMYPTTPNQARFFEPIEGDGNWHTLTIEIPSANKIKALAIGFNSDWSPGGKNPDNESEVNPNMGGTMCYFDDLVLKATQTEYHTLYFEQFDTPTPYWATNTTNADCPSMGGGIQPISSIDNIIFTQLWTGDLYNSYASFFRVPKESHVDFLNIPTEGYCDYELNMDYGLFIQASSGESPYGIVTYMDVSYRETGTEEWLQLESAEIKYDAFHPYHVAIQYEEMKAMDLRISVDTAACSVHLNKIQISGAWNSEGSGLRPAESDVKAYYNSITQTLNVEEDAQIEVFGLDGVLYASSSGRTVFNVADLPRAMYLAKITTAKGQTVLKFVR